MAKGGFREVKMSARDGVAILKVATKLQIVILTPSEESEMLTIQVRSQNPDECLLVFAITESQLKMLKS